MQSGNLLLLLLLVAPVTTLLIGSSGKSTTTSGCLSCHEGIMPFADGRMMAQIRAMGEKHDDPEGCVICHGGTPSARRIEEAHRDVPPALRASGGPQRFYPNPGNALVAGYTCGQCHAGYAQRVQKSLIGTNTEDIHRKLCLAALEKSDHSGGLTQRFGQNDLQDKNGLIPDVGFKAYKDFMALLTRDPELFAQQLRRSPTFAEIKLADMENSDCSPCHGIRPARRALEDEHGSGCTSCHVPYRSGGTYLGQDPTIDKEEPGKLLVHRLQGTAKTQVTLPAQPEHDRPEEESYSGMLIDNCFTCHHDVRDETLNPIGTVMTHYGGRHSDGLGGSLLCQDCHTTIDMHGDGNIPLTSHAQIEIKCEDCHGTVEQAPWELPLGYEEAPGQGDQVIPRGLANEPLDIKGARYDAMQGYLLTARGNPFGNVVKDQDRVLLHSASGQTIEVPILKSISRNKTWKSDFSRQAMFETKAHQEKMECLSCHGDLVQPCYGCHVTATNEQVWSHNDD